MNTVTVAIPFTGKAEGLNHAVRSVFAQTYEDWELILVSDSASEQALQSAQAIRDSRVKVIFDSKNLGLATRLNQIAELTRTEFLFRMDCDDVMHSDRVKLQVERLRAFGEDVVGTRAFLIDQHSTVQGEYLEPDLPTRPVGYMKSNALSHPTVAGRSAWFRANPYDPNMKRCQDMELWARTWSSSEFGKMDNRLMFYRVSSVADRTKRRYAANYHRQVLRRHGPSNIGWVGTALQLGESYTKHLGYSASLVSVAEKYSFSRKFRSLPARELIAAQAEHDQVTISPVPGWPDEA